jgi:hypothetical protein
MLQDRMLKEGCVNFDASRAVIGSGIWKFHAHFTQFVFFNFKKFSALDQNNWAFFYKNVDVVGATHFYDFPFLEIDLFDFFHFYFGFKVYRD